MCDAAVHHCPWLVPRGEELQPSSLRAPFLSKLYHTGGEAFGCEMRVQEREPPPAGPADGITKNQREQATGALSCSPVVSALGWKEGWTVEQFLLLVCQLHILQIHPNAWCPQDISDMATTSAEQGFNSTQFSLEGPSPFVDPSPGDSPLCQTQVAQGK